MENAVDALKIAFAVFVLVIALSVAMYMFNEAKATSDVVLQSSDVTEFMEYETGIEGVIMQSGERIVGLETIIPTLYKYYKENYTIIFRQENGRPLDLYNTQTNVNLWSEGYYNKYYTASKDVRVCSFDVDEETRRHEPWTGNTKYYKQNIDMFLSGKTFYSPSGNGMDYDYSSTSIHGWNGSSGFIETYKNKQFRESLGEYTYSTDTTSQVTSRPESGLTYIKPKKKRVIVYTLMN